MTKMYRILCTINNSTYSYIIDTIDELKNHFYKNISILIHLDTSQCPVFYSSRFKILWLNLPKWAEDPMP